MVYKNRNVISLFSVPFMTVLNIVLTLMNKKQKLKQRETFFTNLQDAEDDDSENADPCDNCEDKH